jgi:hypothetical protein
MGWRSSVYLVEGGISANIDITSDGKWQITQVGRGTSNTSMPAWSGRWDSGNSNVMLYFTEPARNWHETNTEFEWLEFFSFEPSSSLVYTTTRAYIHFGMATGFHQHWWVYTEVVDLAFGGVEGLVVKHVQEHMRLHKNLQRANAMRQQQRARP